MSNNQFGERALRVGVDEDELVRCLLQLTRCKVQRALFTMLVSVCRLYTKSGRF